MTILPARLALREIRLPLAEPFRTAAGVVAERRILLVEMTDADGASAWSECVAESRPTYAPDTVDTCWLALTEWIAPLILGHAFESPGAVHPLLDRHVRGHHMARAAVEMGIWSLRAVREALPLAEVLARAAGASPRSKVDAGIALGMQDSPEALVRRARTALDEGYRRIKMKIEPGRDVEWVRAVREALGPTAMLSVDANCTYTLDSSADRAALARLDTMGLAMIEQPLAHDDLVRHAELQRTMRTPLCLDESIHDESGVAAMLALDSARMVNLKPGRVGGFSEALAIHRQCVDASVPLWCGGMLECGIGRAYNVALASLPGFTEPGDLSPSARYFTRDVVTPAWTMEDGRLRVPLDRPGLGVDVDVDFVDALTTRTTTLEAR